MDRCGSLWIVLGSLWIVVDGCGSFWVVLGRFGWFLVLVTTKNVAPGWYVVFVVIGVDI